MSRRQLSVSGSFGIIVVGLFAVAAEHFVRFMDQALGFGDAGAQRCLAGLDFPRLLGPALGSFLFIGHDGFHNQLTAG